MKIPFKAHSYNPQLPRSNKSVAKDFEPSIKLLGLPKKISRDDFNNNKPTQEFHKKERSSVFQEASILKEPRLPSRIDADSIETIASSQSGRSVIVGSEIEGIKETFKLKSKLNSLDSNFKDFFKTMMKKSKKQSNPELRLAFDKMLGNKQKVIREIRTNLIASIAVTDINKHDALATNDKEAINKLKKEKFNFEVQTSTTNGEAEVKIFLSNKDETLIELYPIDNADFILQQPKYSFEV